ncbi:HalD/BesD family halogenase [Aliamphritea hakodatensis]|uniref:HalD/BesD family halogenase n=1 Tax=Aliamphritea hakodatensis TaxID=2895352 RepID=UPI0022FD41F8|nr:hypothetical protein [Aliamphritea hakodatensis]
MNGQTVIQAEGMQLGDIVDLQRYPIDQLEHPEMQALLAHCREALDDIGCVVIRNFVRPESLQRMTAEAKRLLPETFWSQGSHNPYFTPDDESLPADHPKRFFERRESGYINSDVLEDSSDLRAIYEDPQMLRFVGECLNIWPLYCWADPLGRNPYSVMDSGHYFPWHFDGNEFTVSILVQESEAGGCFEFAPDVRHPEDECFDDVRDVLAGNSDRVHQLQLRPGDLQLFKGRFSMHRVTRIEGDTMRIIALPTYSTDPFTVNRPKHSEHLYGRAMPIHYERENMRVDNLTD